jgi:hypothetical protein
MDYPDTRKAIADYRQAGVAPTSFELTASRRMGCGLGKEQRMLLLGMGASRMTLADLENAAQASYATGALLAFTVGSIASWKTGVPSTERQKKTVSHALRALHRRGLVGAWKIPRWQYLHELPFDVRRALENLGLVAVPVPGKSLVVYALTPDGERVAQEILKVRRCRRGARYARATPV